jgi:hypothetical protein
MKKWYKRKWVHAGIAYRKENYMIIKPDEDNPNWLVRLVHGDAGQQKDEYEGTFTSERKAFKFANKAIWIMKWNNFINKIIN